MKIRHLFGLFILWILSCTPSFGQLLSKEQQVADFDTLCRRLETVHPDLYMYQTKEEYNRLKSHLRMSFTDSLSISDFYLKIAPFMASIKDGHSMVLPPFTKDFADHAKNNGKTMPLRIKAAGEVFVVDFPIIVDTQICSGDTILTINGVSSKEILYRLYRLFASEKGNAIKEISINAYLPLLLWYTYRWHESYLFALKRGNKVWEERISGIPRSQALDVIKARQAKDKPMSFTYQPLPDCTQATITLTNFYKEEELKQFCDLVFEDMAEKKIPQLILDVRNNSGGSSKAVERLISYFSHSDYALYSKSQIKVSAYSKAYNRDRHKDIYGQICNLPDGSLFDMGENTIKSNRARTNLYHGEVIILVNGKTYSGASTFAHTMQKLGIANVEGETGCSSVYFGNSLPFTLPNSKIEYFISFSKFYE